MKKESDNVEAAVAVSYAEFDLSKPAGASALYDRLQRAAAQVCGLNARAAGLTGGASTASKKQCYRDALSRAIAQVDAPLLEAQHAG
jgi:UrcA family protein